MLYLLEIENFYSVRDRQTLDLRIPKNVPDYPERFSPIFEGSSDRAPKVISLFGANGSGKSTVLKALAFISWFLDLSFQNNASLPFERFNDEESSRRPTKLAIELGGIMDLAVDDGPTGQHGLYRYELEFSPQNAGLRVVSKEALYQKRNGRGKWVRVFERKGSDSILGSKSFPITGFSQVIDKVRPDASVISTLALFEHQAAKTLRDAARSIVKNIFTDKTEVNDHEVIQYLAHNPDTVEELNRELQRIDVGVEQMQVLATPSGPVAMFRHEGLDVDMPWLLESQGTRSFIRIFPLLLLALKRGSIAIADELDLSIHPLILPEIARWFYDFNRNPHSAQLWMSCHSVSLLDDLTKEEVVFCEKDHLGRSRIYSLMDVQAVRRSDNLYKKYLGGTYGAVPQIG